jgi:hypothetical protein
MELEVSSQCYTKYRVDPVRSKLNAAKTFKTYFSGSVYLVHYPWSYLFLWIIRRKTILFPSFMLQAPLSKKHTMHLHFKGQFDNAVYRNDRCLFWESCETHKYTKWAKCRPNERQDVGGT